MADDDREDEVRKLAYKIAEERLAARMPGGLTPLPHRSDVEEAMSEARKRLDSN